MIFPCHYVLARFKMPSLKRGHIGSSGPTLLQLATQLPFVPIVSAISEIKTMSAAPGSQEEQRLSLRQ